ELEIKKAAKAGQKDVCTVLAKQLVQLRNQKTKNLGMSAKISAVGAQGKTMNSMNVMANAVGTTTQTMKAMEKQMPLDKFAADLREFTQQQDKMDMRSELMEETLDSMLDADSDAENEVINQVLDEIGIEMNAKVSKAPAIPGHSLAHSSKEDDLDKILASLAK
uniref:Charged multivesicular body protein 2b n=1 Tax=Acrobeloides nanus TaxID=290746 RepID=A0A914D248_9BILA